MTTPIIKTAADQALQELLKAAQAGLPGNADFSSLRSAAVSDFEENGLPTRRVEEWKYSDLKRAMPADLALAEPVSADTARGHLSGSGILRSIEKNQLVLVNGCFSAELSDLSDLGDAISVRSVADALQAGDFVLDDPEIAKGDIALSLNTALLQDGVIVEIAEGAEISKPIEIRHVMLGGGLATLRNRVVIGKGAKVGIIETFVGDEASYQLNSAIDYRIGDEAKLNVLRIINEGDNAIHLGSTTAKVGGQVHFEHFTLSASGQFVRSQSFVAMLGEYSDADLFGASLVNGNRHSDITLKMDHAVPHCNSKEQYRTVLDDKAEAVFQGQIIVRQYAQKTDAKMMSQALLLSEDASFNNKPELEIYADDVVCGHGATCGDLDEDLLFYLRARGISKDVAKKMLVMAFLAEAIENVSNEQFVEALESYILDRLGLSE
ncbi:Fe-S cluster assembly protein SufD [uncultured Cohaesibacter sp.]|uniref:Fe-S cluster assembly protein SufD n=1 Tax=uncultured Cohaesibacter sp. TaxID=1002546 RepID=UPI0029C9A813|nr:Fe-S cluster assembly protein SufD [uncultured Cohaesibacter sp.]